jgi:hypothetical protein
VLDGAALEDAIRERVDDLRARHGLARLRPDPALARAARGHGRAMAEHCFFAHHSPLPGLAEPADRARAEGARCEGVGENLALLSEAVATAEPFVEMWMNSPGHRKNLLTPAWDVTGVGVFTGRDGTVYATQLFGMAARLVLDAAELRGGRSRWMLCVRMRIGAGYSLAAFAESRLLGASDADARGEAVLQVDAPSRREGARVTFSRRRAGGSDPWIDLHAAEIEEDAGGRPVLVPAVSHRDGRFELLEQRLVEAPAAGSRLYLSGHTREPAILVIADRLVRHIKPGAFEIEHLLGGHGMIRIALGFPDTSSRYELVHQFDAHPATVRLDQIY